jgi:hypothetical protein
MRARSRKLVKAELYESETPGANEADVSGSQGKNQSKIRMHRAAFAATKSRFLAPLRCARNDRAPQDVIPSGARDLLFFE